MEEPDKPHIEEKYFEVTVSYTQAITNIIVTPGLSVEQVVEKVRQHFIGMEVTDFTIHNVAELDGPPEEEQRPVSGKPFLRIVN